MKKLMVFLIAAVMIISAGASAFSMISAARNSEKEEEQAATSAKSSQEQASEVVGQFLKNLKSGSFDDAYALVDQNAQDTFDLRTKKENILESANDQDEEVQQAALAYFNLLSASLARDYSVDSAKVTDDTANVAVTLHMYDPEDVADLDEDALDAWMEEYYDEHEDELNELYNSEGEDAVTEELNRQSYLYSYQTMSDNIKKAQTLEKQVVFVLNQNSDKEWTISQIAFASE
jgi:flagellar basal body-associated protein FliL